MNLVYDFRAQICFATASELAKLDHIRHSVHLEVFQNPLAGLSSNLPFFNLNEILINNRNLLHTTLNFKNLADSLTV